MLSPIELELYNRHILIPEVGVEGQQKLKNSSVLIVGMGGLGCPISLYLAAAGVGRIGLVDFDRVDLSNLQRQVLYRSSDQGNLKVEMAAQSLQSLNPHIKIEKFAERLTNENAIELFSRFDLIVDGSDNFTTRYLVNDAAFFAKKVLVSSSILSFEGHLSVFDGNDGPCYRCLFPEAPPLGAVPSCGEAGVLGVLPGIMGTLQATEVLKLILGIGDHLKGCLLTVNALSMDFNKFNYEKRDDCPLCGNDPRIKELKMSNMSCSHGDLAEISCQELKAKIDQREKFQLLDVRQPEELEDCKLDNIIHIPLGELETRFKELNTKSPVYVICSSGGRSARATEFLTHQGFSATNVAGGMMAWINEIDSSDLKS